MDKDQQINIRMNDEELKQIDAVMINMRDKGIIRRMSRAEVVRILVEKAYNFVLKDSAEKK